jgi:ethanolamine transporter EutH
VTCVNDTKTYGTCDVGILSCSAETGDCPFLFKASDTLQGDFSAGIIAIVVAIAIILLSTFFMVKLVRKMLVETPVEVIARITGMNNYVTMIFGCLSTLVLGSSSLTESAVNPFLACGVVELEQVSTSQRSNKDMILSVHSNLLLPQMYPFSLGSNIGMAAVTLLQSLVSGRAGFFHVALANIFFNGENALLF